MNLWHHHADMLEALARDLRERQVYVWELTGPDDVELFAHDTSPRIVAKDRAEAKYPNARGIHWQETGPGEFTLRGYLLGELKEKHINLGWRMRLRKVNHAARV